MVNIFVIKVRATFLTNAAGKNAYLNEKKIHQAPFLTPHTKTYYKQIIDLNIKVVKKNKHRPKMVSLVLKAHDTKPRFIT